MDRIHCNKTIIIQIEKYKFYIKIELSLLAHKFKKIQVKNIFIK